MSSQYAERGMDVVSVLLHDVVYCSWFDLCYPAGCAECRLLGHQVNMAVEFVCHTSATCYM